MDAQNEVGSRRLKALIAEDDVVSRMLLNEILKDSNIETLFARNGKEAVDMVVAHPDIDFILMDLKMPIMSGYEATVKIRQMGFAKPIIAQTAYAGNDDRERVLSTGFDAFLAKPIRRNALTELIQQLVPGLG